MAIEQTASVGKLSVTGFQDEPPSVVFQTPEPCGEPT